MFSEEDIKKFCDACNKFSLTIEESARCIEVLSKKSSKDFPKSTPKTYGNSLLKKINS